MKSKKKFRRIIDVIVAVLLAFSLTFGYGIPSYAASGTKSIYVISSITVKRTVTSTKKTQTYKYKYKYNKNGLLKGVNMSTTDKSDGSVYYSKYTYKGKKLKTAFIQQGDGAPESYKYTWKSGKITKAVEKYNGGNYSYSYKDGKIIKLTNGKLYSINYSYDSKKRLISSGSNESYEYDSKGNMSQKKNYSQITTFKTTKKSGRITKIKSDARYAQSTITIKYKKVKVPSGYKSTVEKQRKFIVFTQGYGVSTSSMPLGSL